MLDSRWSTFVSCFVFSINFMRENMFGLKFQLKKKCLIEHLIN